MAYRITARRVCGLFASAACLLWALAIVVAPLWDALRKLFAVSRIYGVLATTGLVLIPLVLVVRLRPHHGVSVRRIP